MLLRLLSGSSLHKPMLLACAGGQSGQPRTRQASAHAASATDSSACYRCEHPGHQANRCPGTDSRCQACGKRGAHTEAVCWTAHSELKPDWRGKGKSSGCKERGLESAAGCAGSSSPEANTPDMCRDAGLAMRARPHCQHLPPVSMMRVQASTTPRQRHMVRSVPCRPLMILSEIGRSLTLGTWHMWLPLTSNICRPHKLTSHPSLSLPQRPHMARKVSSTQWTRLWETKSTRPGARSTTHIARRRRRRRRAASGPKSCWTLEKSGSSRGRTSRISPG
jgi:hypothetical protein